jgi:hypothetical protein
VTSLAFSTNSPTPEATFRSRACSSRTAADQTACQDASVAASHVNRRFTERGTAVAHPGTIRVAWSNRQPPLTPAASPLCHGRPIGMAFPVRPREPSNGVPVHRGCKRRCSTDLTRSENEPKIGDHRVRVRTFEGGSVRESPKSGHPAKGSYAGFLIANGKSVAFEIIRSRS